jgi:RNA polymerase sigma-70 factor (ECF subfamily)
MPLTSHAPDDAALVERVVRRDPEALGELYDRHHRLLFSLILRVLRDRGEAEDVLQEVFVRVWERAETYAPSLGAPSAWLVRIARNRAIDRLRSRRVRAHVSEAAEDTPREAAAPAPDPEALARTAESRRAILAALDALPPEQRRLVEAAYFEGYTQSELAEKFGLPLGTVKTRIRTAMQALRAILGA